MPETSVRAALGAGRWDLIRPVLAETSLLAMGGGVFGLGLAYAILGYVRSLRGVTLPRLPDVNLDQQSVVYAAVCCAAAALLAGIGPIAGVLQPRLLPALRSRGETTSSSGKSLRLFHRSLASLQIALALVLLSGAGVLIKHLMDIAPGLADADPRHVMIGSLGSAMIPPEVPNSRAAVRRYMFDRDREILRQIRLVPDVRSAALFTGDLVPSAPVRIQGHTEVSHSFVRTDATAQFFAASGYRLRAGRLFGNGEFNGDDRARPVVVNEEFLRIFAADLTPQSALGRTVVRRDPKGIAQHFGTIAGVVNNLNVRATKVEPGIFRAADEKSWPALLLVRTTGDPLELTGNVGRILREHHVPLVEPHTLEDRFTSAVATRRFERNLLASFAGVALVLAVIGIYGVLSYGVSQRTREIGIRMALGAERFDVLVDVLRDGLLLIGCGAVLGLAASFALARWMSSMIPGLPSSEPAMLAIVCVMLIVVAAAAAFVPARRATAIDPLPAVRHE
jgi:predicted permease